MSSTITIFCENEVDFSYVFYVVHRKSCLGGQFHDWSLSVWKYFSLTNSSRGMLWESCVKIKINLNFVFTVFEVPQKVLWRPLKPRLGREGLSSIINLFQGNISFESPHKHDGRSNCAQMLFKVGVLKNFAIFTGKYQCWRVFIVKLQA